MTISPCAVGKDVLIYTSRRLIHETDQTSALRVRQLISAGLVAIVEHLTAPPAWIIAKGGITASDIVTRGLEAKRTEVLGQALAGVPIWRIGPGSRWPGMICVVFPGNVGDTNTLAQMARILRGERIH